MRATLLLAWRYVTHHGVRSVLLAACIALVFLLPVAVSRLVEVYSTDLAARARATPLVAGAPGSRFDLVLDALYFEGAVPRTTNLAVAQAIAESGLARAIPLFERHTAQGFPVVGTTPDYFSFRGLVAERGALPALLGDAVVGAGVARELGLAPGDTLLTDRGSLYDLSLAAPLRMSITGVLGEAGTADDAAVFCDLKTAWIVEGIGHGHVAAELERPDRVLGGDGEHIVLSAATNELTEITSENIDSFHFHGEPEEFPLTAVLVVPRDDRGATILKGRFRNSETVDLLVPSVVVEELLGFVLRLKLFFDANALLVGVATGLFLVLVVSLTVRMRGREIETLERIGCARGRVVSLLAAEVGIVALAGLLLAWSCGLAFAGVLASVLGLPG